MASNKQQINWKEVKKQLEIGNFKASEDLSKYTATVAVSWQENKDGTNNSILVA